MKLKSRKPSTEVATAPKMAKCRDCKQPFPLPKRRGRPPVRCETCAALFRAQRDTGVTTSERIALKQAAKATVALDATTPTVVVSETISSNAVANHEAARAEAKALRKTLKSLGWAVQGSRNDTLMHLVLTATRGDEVIHLEWSEGKVVTVVGGASPKAEAPAPARTMATPFDPSRLPFDPQNDPDVVVLRAVLGHRITWMNRLGGNTETDIVRNSSRQTVTLTSNPHGERILNFIGDNGYRSVSLTALRKVH